MKRIYWLMAAAGFLATLFLTIVPILISGDPGFSIPARSGMGFIGRYWLISLVFFVIITLVLSGIRRKEDAHGIGRQFLFSFIGFSLGSWFASILFLLAVGLAWKSMHLSIF